MWDGPGPRQGPRGGPSFRGDHRGEMFGGRDRPMPDYRGRDEMNMGHMGPRPHDLPSMDMRRMDGPPMRGRDMDPRDMQGREPNRDFFRRGEEPDFTLRRQYEISIRDKLMNFSGFPGPGRNLSEMGGRGMPPWDPNNKFNDIRDRESFQPNMPRFNNPNVDGRRGFPMDRNDGCRDMRDWQPMGTGDGNRYDMDLPPHENRRMDSDRRGGPPFNPRGEFDSDMDFRNRPGPSAEFRGRDRSPLRFGSNDVPSVDRARSDMPPDFSGPQRSEFMGAENALRQNEYPESSDSPLTDYRSGEEMTLAEEWKNRQKEKKPFVGKSIGGVSEPNFPVGFGNDVKIRDAPPFQERNRPPVEFPRKDIGFARDERFPVIDLPPIGSKGPQENPPPEISKFTGPPGRENESEHWLGERPPKHIQNKSHGQERPHYHQEKNLPKPENQEPKDCFKGMEVSPSPARVKMELEHNFQSSNTMQVRDQDYRDIDYRTGSGRNFDYKHEDLQGPEEKLITESKPITPSKFSESGSQDQDYRSASVEEKVSNTISIIGIPKTATMEQILGAFAVRDGVPMQGMKIKNVVPGYSYDTAYVEFLNLEDAVHFMESNKVAHPRHSTKAHQDYEGFRGHFYRWGWERL